VEEILYEFGNKDTKLTMYKDGNMRIEGATIATEEPSQLDRIEKKADRILELLEDKELSTSFEKDLVSTAKKINEDIDRRNEERWKNL